MASVGLCPAPTGGPAITSLYNAASTLFGASMLMKQQYQKNADVPDETWVDYIVVGGGTAGGIVANRMSEDSGTTVLLLEAGPDPPLESELPRMAEKIGKQYQFNYTFTGTKAGAGLADLSPFWTRSSMLGGSSSANNMAYLKGVENDYRQWYEAGNDEWNPDQVKKYFKKAENLQDATLLADPLVSANYGTDGPLLINKFNSTKANITKQVLSAFEEIGIKNVPDVNTANLMGSGTFPALVANGQRQSIASQYVRPYADRSNLMISKNSVVTKILMDKDTLLAYGVEATQNGKKVTYYANNEIILCAGAIYTPMLLMLSGIGPEKTLLANKINYIVSSPGVGQNLQYQTVVPVPIFADQPAETSEIDNAFEIIRYLHDRTGSMADLMSTDVTAFYAEKQEATRPDFQNLLGIFNKNSTDSFSMLEAYKPATADALKAKAAEKALFMFQVVNLRPKTTGSVTISSNKPEDAPIIRPNFFKDPKDLDHIVTGMQMLNKMPGTTFFKSINAEIGRMPFTDCDGSAVDSVEYSKCVATNFASIAGNPVGTAKMGSDDKAVVDSRLLVRGMSGLRIVDESVMPTPPSCVSDAPIIMLAELASDLIKEDNGGDNIGEQKMKKNKLKSAVKKA